MMRRMPAEWERQGAVLMAMPHKESDWYPYLEEAQATFERIIKEIAKRQKCILIVDDWGYYRESIGDMKNLIHLELPTNDTWARDFGAISVEEEGRLWLLDFGFNGWGLKFPSNLDNQINRQLAKRGVYHAPLETKNFILEGGSIESNGAGLILTNTQCLLEGNRNPEYTKAQIEEVLRRELGAKKVLWCDHGYLAGDDTDSHIDTLARFVGENRIVYLKGDDSSDEHYGALQLMEKELQAFRNLHGEPLELIPLPFTQAIHYDGERLPASYANFLFINGAVLLPVYGDPKDKEAIEVMKRACPKHEIIPIDCRVLIRQHGSLHCVTMQLPKGAI